MEPCVLDLPTLVEDEDPFQFLLDDRNSSPRPIEETLAAALLRLNDPKHDELRYDPLKAFDDLAAASSSSNTFPLTYDCLGNCSFDAACTLPDCTLDPGSAQNVCCGDECQDGLTVTCSERDCAAPNRCDDVCGTCNNTSCQTEPCADPACPVSFSHFDVCFEAACAPSPGSGPCSPAPCDLGNCDGTFVTNTCGEATHHGWDPTCPGSLVNPQDVVHDYEGMPPPSNLYGQAPLQPQPSMQQGGQYQDWFSTAADINQHAGPASGVVPYGAGSSPSSQHQSSSSLSPATSNTTLYDNTHWPNTNLPRPRPASARKRGAPCCQPSKRQRMSADMSSQASSSSTSMATGNSQRLAPMDHSMSLQTLPTSSVCQWVMNPQDSAHSRQQCGFVAASAKELHDHLMEAHTSQLNSHTRFHCHWADCPRLLVADYGQKSKLNRHLLTHSNYLPYPCSFPGCSKAFSTNDQRRNHEATHTDERKYCCDWPGCGAKFRHATSLSTHRYTHTGEKPYVCWICGHREGDPSNKSKHMKREHPDLPRQRPADWDEGKVKRELESRGYSWPPQGCKLNDGCDK